MCLIKIGVHFIFIFLSLSDEEQIEMTINKEDFSFFLFLMMIQKMRKTMIINNIFCVFIACRSLLRNPNEYWLLNKV